VPIKVGVVGYGTIGARVAEAVMKQPDMELIGVAKTTPDYKAKTAISRGVKIFIPESSVESWKRAGVRVDGLLEDLVREADVVVDATPKGVGRANSEMYKKEGKKAIFQGGEKKDLVEATVVAQVNYDEARGKRMIRVPSCNTTALSRISWFFEREYGVERIIATIARRAADPADKKEGIIDNVEFDPVRPPSHHGEDVRTVLKNLNIFTTAIKIPTTHAHLHLLNLKLRRRASREEIIDALSEERRIMLVSSEDGIATTADVFELSRHLGRPMNNIYENVIWVESIHSDGEWVYLAQAVHQEAIVVPENIDAIRAIASELDAESSMNTTDRTLGIVRGRI